jgi:hypothetical protein
MLKEWLLTRPLPLLYDGDVARNAPTRKARESQTGLLCRMGDRAAPFGILWLASSGGGVIFLLLFANLFDHSLGRKLARERLQALSLFLHGWCPQITRNKVGGNRSFCGSDDTHPMILRPMETIIEINILTDQSIKGRRVTQGVDERVIGR